MSRVTWKLSNPAFGMLLVVPCLAILGFTVVYPLIRSVFLSFHYYSLVDRLTGLKFIGFDNYRSLFASASFLETWRVTLVFVGASVGGQFLLGFASALLLNRQVAFRSGIRGLLLVPWIIPTVVAGFLWKWIYNAQFGVFNWILQYFGFISEFRGWISTPQLAMFSVVLTNVWKGFPFHMIILLAGLQTIPVEIMEAATVDGAGGLHRFRHIILPSLRYIIGIDILISIIWTFQNFTLPWIMTEGGPASATTTLAINIYRTAFQSFDIGRSAAVGTTWLIFIFLFSIIFLRVVAGKVEIR